jgi:predicted nucleotidyltransferase
MKRPSIYYKALKGFRLHTIEILIIEMNNLTFEEIRKNNNLLFESIRGSHLFGLDTETSDIDTFGIFCCESDLLLGTGNNYVSMIQSEKNDDYWDEIGKFVKELCKSNPNALEALFTPEKHIKFFNPVIQPLWDIRDQLITKDCFRSFSGYAVMQIKKAKGLGKAINIDPDSVRRRKNPLEFCWVAQKDGDGDIRLDKWLAKNGLKQEHCGIVHLTNSLEMYNLYYDWFADKDLKPEDYIRLRYGELGWIGTKIAEKELEKGKRTEFIGYRGILDPHDLETSQLRCSSISKKDAKKPLCTFQYNYLAFSQHCADYKRYWDWVKNRNPERFELNKGYNYDGKNCCACIRLMTMAREMAEGKGMLLDRSNIDRDFLLDIKTHKLTFDEIMKQMESIQADMEVAFQKSTLPEKPDAELLEKILVSIRKSHYGLK